MTIEALLTSIDTKLGQLLSTFSGPTTPYTTPYPVPANPIPQQPVATPGEPVKRGRGRPPKGETTAVTEVTPPPTPAPTVQDPIEFLNTAPPKPVTLEDVRNALVTFQKRVNSPEKAREILKRVGGSDTLVSLPESNWLAVIEAANKA